MKKLSLGSSRGISLYGKRVTPESSDFSIDGSSGVRGDRNGDISVAACSLLACQEEDTAEAPEWLALLHESLIRAHSMNI